MNVIGIIPARYESSRFPGKPLVDIMGHPMIWWVYQRCLKVTEFNNVFVATDDNRIAEVCKKYQMNCIITSDTCQTGSDRVGEAAGKIEGSEDDLFVNIQGDEPLINPAEIEQVIRIFNDESVYFGSLRIEITDPDEIAANSTVKVVVDKNSDALYFSRNVIPSNSKGGKYARVFRHVGIYAYKRSFLNEFIHMPQTELEIGEGIEPLRAMENGYKIRVAETTYSSVGVDYPEHIEKVKEEIAKHPELLLK